MATTEVYQFDDVMEARLTLVAAKYGITKAAAVSRLMSLAVRLDADMDQDGVDVQTHMRHGLFRRWDWKEYMSGT